MASLILVTVFVGMIEAVVMTSNTMDHARRVTIANQILMHELEDLRNLGWSGSTNINGLTTASTTIAIDPQFWPAWNSAMTYSANHVVSYNGAYYRCILANANTVPPNATYWTAVTTAATTDVVVIQGATFTVDRTVTSSNPVTNIREINFTVTWVVKSSRRDASNNPLTFTYTRSASGWYGKYGLNLSYQRS